MTQKDAGTVSIITGAGSGFGAGVARMMVGRDSNVVLTDLNFPAVDALAQELNTAAGKTVAVSMKCDATSWTDTVAMFDLAESSFKTGRIDFVFANAGIAEIPFFPQSHVVPTTKKALVEPTLTTLNIDLNGQLLTSAAALQTFLSQDIGKNGTRGKLIVTASALGIYHCYNMPLYCAAKAGMVSFARSSARKYAKDNITINAICPNLVKTGILGVAGSAALEAGFFDGLLTPFEYVMQAFERLVDGNENGASLVVNPEGVYAHPQDTLKWDVNGPPLHQIDLLIEEGWKMEKAAAANGAK